ncbi:MAG: tannase/feruloyl esterase family alpha/beta hydrolase [Gammaproteobacteria bacterium]|nr:tannase/feruloyl esterase family alpha/beta hydrolase [Gammaproteobacteria bacterium]
MSGSIRPHRGAYRHPAPLAGALLLCGAIGSLQAQTFQDAAASPTKYAEGRIEPVSSCAALAELELPELVRITTRSIAAAGGVPAHCRVDGTIDPEITFQVNLPQPWNGRFYMVGNGGHAGQQPDDPSQVPNRDQALARHFVMAATDTGHDADKEPGGSFVLSNPQKAIDYAYRAVHRTAVTAKAIAQRYYGKPVAYAYWNSCSNGGRQGLLEAQRYPEDFDGIVANAPWVDQTGFTIGALWNQRALDDVTLTPGKLALLAERVQAKCDAVDGLGDGLIDDPRQCPVTVARDVPSCPAGVDDDSCLTAAQAAAIQKIYDGPRDRQGRPLFPGFMPGSEALVRGVDGTLNSSWLNLIVPGAPDRKAADFNLAEATMRYLVPLTPQPDWDYRTFDFDRDVETLDRWSRLADATDINLRAFRARGGKLLLTYGWSDQILQPLMGVAYYEQAVTANGPNGEDFLRLFMVPGMTHCAGGPGPDQFDSVTAVIDWVETGKAPDRLIARKLTDGTVTRSRPLCPYPQVARYQGQGSSDAAENFACTAP